VTEHRRAGIDLAFLEDDELLARGWLARPSGGFVLVSEIRLATASLFQGERDPVLPLAFVIRDEAEAHRYDRMRVIEEQGSRVGLDSTHVDSIEGREATLSGDAALPRRSGSIQREVDMEMITLPRNAVRIARSRSMPAGLPSDAAWVHVSLREQVLVAYEGPRAVYATLVSTGLAEHPTPRGLFRVWHKERHAPMHGDPPEPYFVDEVPFVQYFSKGIALHGTFWHDRFGRRASHGCVNLSMADAEWLFDWAPPLLPSGWHAIEPEAAKRSSLWVLVEP
jgi:lipoprotein-anchoring transpeptidase ErfK/SrfK